MNTSPSYVPNHLVWAILSTLFCCLPLGIVSIVFAAQVNGKLAAGLLYSRTGDRVLLLAASVFPEFRGKGVAARLLGGVLDSLRKDNMTATVSCPFAAAYIRAHPEYADIVDARFPGNPHGHHH